MEKSINKDECNTKKQDERRRPNRRSNKGKSKYTPKPKQLSETKGDDINDSSFYYSDNVLKEQITNFSFNQFAGIPFKIGNVVGSSRELRTSIPTIMKIKMNPSAGMTQLTTGFDVTDGVFKAGLKNYYMLSAGNAKTTNYQPQDVTMLIFALASIMEYQSFLQRVLGTPYMFNVRNRDLPQKLIQAQGVSYDDLVKNMAAYRVRFNTILQMFNKIPVPNNVRAFMKSSSLYSNYYTDDTSPMAQFYVMVPDQLWKLMEDVEPDMLGTFTAIPNSPTLFSTLLDYFEQQINAVLTSAKFNFIFADILRLADKGVLKTFQYGLIPDAYVAPILYSHEFNLWIDNATILSRPNGSVTDHSTASNWVIDDIDNNTLKYSPNFDYAHPSELTEYVINFDENNPSTEDRIAATRLVAAYSKINDSSAKATCSTHYVTGIDVLDGNDIIELPPFNLMAFSDATVRATWESIIRKFDVVSKFKHAPHLHAYDRTITEADQITYDTSNYDYYTTVDYDFLQRMFDAEWLTYLTIE